MLTFQDKALKREYEGLVSAWRQAQPVRPQEPAELMPTTGKLGEAVKAHPGGSVKLAGEKFIDQFNVSRRVASGRVAYEFPFMDGEREARAAIVLPLTVDVIQWLTSVRDGRRDYEAAKQRFEADIAAWEDRVRQGLLAFAKKAKTLYEAGPQGRWSFDDRALPMRSKRKDGLEDYEAFRLVAEPPHRLLPPVVSARMSRYANRGSLVAELRKLFDGNMSFI